MGVENGNDGLHKGMRLQIPNPISENDPQFEPDKIFNHWKKIKDKQVRLVKKKCQVNQYS